MYICIILCAVVALFIIIERIHYYVTLKNRDRKMMETIIKYYGGGPVGLETLAATVGEEAVTLEDVYEPYLMQIGFISRTPRGRCVTRAAYEHLGLKFPEPQPRQSAEIPGQASLFDCVTGRCYWQ